jgi:hypothetical protein
LTKIISNYSPTCSAIHPPAHRHAVVVDAKYSKTISIGGFSYNPRTEAARTSRCPSYHERVVPSFLHVQDCVWGGGSYPDAAAGLENI